MVRNDKLQERVGKEITSSLEQNPRALDLYSVWLSCVKAAVGFAVMMEDSVFVEMVMVA